MLLATKTLDAAGGGAGVAVGIAVAVGVALGVADTVAVGLVDGAEPAAPGVPQAASTTGAIKVSRAFLVICSSPLCRKGRRRRGRCPLRGGGSRHTALHAYRNLARER